jgi:hypothetical protein
LVLKCWRYSERSKIKIATSNWSKIIFIYNISTTTLSMAYSIMTPSIKRLFATISTIDNHINNTHSLVWYNVTRELLHNSMRNYEIWQKLLRFHKTNKISWNFIVIILCFDSVAMYFVDFQFRSWYFWKLTAKFHFFRTDLKFQRFELGYAMAKV